MKPLLSSPAFWFFCHWFWLKKWEFLTLNNEEQKIVIKEFMNLKTRNNKIEKAYEELYLENICENERTNETIKMSQVR